MLHKEKRNQQTFPLAMAYSYTNRQGRTHYFRAVETKTGKFRYYVTTSDAYPNLVDAIPEGFEVVELPEEAKVVIRKKKPVLTNTQEKEILHDAIEEFSALTDFFIYAEGDYLYVYHSQFNYAGGQEPNLSRAEAKEHFSTEIEKWMRFLTSLKFRLIDEEERVYQAERMVHTGFFSRQFYPIGEPGKLEDLAKEFGQHLGRASFFGIVPNGWEE